MRLFKILVCFVVVFGPAVGYAEQTEDEKILEVQKIELYQRPLLMVGMGLTKLMNDDYYIGAFYMDEAAQYAGGDDLINFKATRRMEYRFASSRKVSARGFSRKIAEGIRINNSKANIKAEAEKLGIFMGFFKGSYNKGDVIAFDYNNNNERTYVKLNGKVLGEIRRSHDLYRLLVKTWVGERPPSSTFKEGIVGQNETAYAISLLQRFISL